MCSCGLEPETTLHYLLHCNTNKKIIKSAIMFLKTCESLLWLVSVLGPVSCRFYSFFKCIYVDVCLQNVNQYYRKNSYLVLVSLCTWRTSPAVNGVSIIWGKVLLLIFNKLSFSFDRADNHLSNNVIWFFNFFSIPIIEAQCLFLPSGYLMQQRLQFGSLKDGVEIVWWVIKAINRGCINVGQTNQSSWLVSC